MTLFTSRTLAALLAASAMAVAAPLATAQQAQQPAQSEMSAADIAEEDLQRFAMAAIEVQRVNQTYQAQFQDASPDEQQQIQQQAAQEAAAAVQEVGLTVEEYNEFSRLAVENPEVAERVNEHIQEMLPQQQ